MLTEFIFGMSKDDAINIMNGSSLVDKRGVYIIFFYYIKSFYYINFLLYIKMSESAYLNYYQKKPGYDYK